MWSKICHHKIWSGWKLFWTCERGTYSKLLSEICIQISYAPFANITAFEIYTTLWQKWTWSKQVCVVSEKHIDKLLSCFFCQIFLLQIGTCLTMNTYSHCNLLVHCELMSLWVKAKPGPIQCQNNRAGKKKTILLSACNYGITHCFHCLENNFCRNF